jgi:hypothetical protein
VQRKLHITREADPAARRGDLVGDQPR